MKTYGASLVLCPFLWCSAARADDLQDQVAHLKAQLVAQEEQINQLRKTLDEQRAVLDKLTPMIPPAHATEPDSTPVTAPLHWTLGEVSITPQGFLDLGGVFRSGTAGSGFPTNFGSVPYPDTVNGNLHEARLSSQNSRLGFRMDTKLHGVQLLGLMEADFLGFFPGNAAVTSNSDSLRLRLFWVDARKGKWEALAGQSWSLLTPNRSGISPLPSDLFFTQDVDPNYHVGQVWSRAPQLRGVYHPNKSVAFAMSIESAEQYGGGSAGGGAVTLPSLLSPFYNSQLNLGSGGASVPSPHQDWIGKIAFDGAPANRAVHVEFIGVFRRFAFYNPINSMKFHQTGGGGSINANLELFPHFRLLTNNFFSAGGGRYIFGQAPDVIIRGDGSPSLVNSYSTLDGFEYQVRPKVMLYGYYGGTYIRRNIAIDPATGGPVGYGYEGSPNSQNRAIQEVTGGAVFTLWRHPSYGAMQFMTQYSYIFRQPWFVAPYQPRSGNLSALYVNFRFTLPGAPPPVH